MMQREEQVNLAQIVWETKPSCESRKAGENKSNKNYNFLKDLIIL